MIFAGFTDDFLKSKVGESSSTVEVFDQYQEQWRVLKTTGSPPKGLFQGACCSTPNGDLYLYGGHDGSSYYGGLYKLAMSSQELEWSQLHELSVETDPTCPMKKFGCEMVCFVSKNLAVIGGFGIPYGPPQPGSTFIKDERYTDGRGFTNEIQLYDIEECKQLLAILEKKCSKILLGHSKSITCFSSPLSLKIDAGGRHFGE